MANITTPDMQELLAAGVHFGHKVSRAHPRMKPYIFGSRDGISIIDLEKSEQMLKTAAEKMYELGKEGKVVLIVGTKKQAREIVEELAKRANIPYLSHRWIGGVLTNFDEVKKNIRKLVRLKEDQQKGNLSHYTKKEQLLLSKKIIKFEREMGGIATLESVPDVLFIVDAVADKTAVKEGVRMGILMVGITDTNADPTAFDYPVASNDDGIKALNIVCDALVNAYIKGLEDSGRKEKAVKAKEDKVEDEKKEEVLPESILEEAEVLEELVEKEVIEEQERRAEKAVEE